MNKAKHFHSLLLSLYLCFLIISILTPCKANEQVTNLFKLLKSKSSKNSSLITTSWVTLPTQIKSFRVRVDPQDGLMKANKITTLPGQPDGVDFDQYAGYINVDSVANKTLFYYFVESPHNSSLKPLVLWLNGGPGCSSIGNGGLRELGPFRVKSDGKTLYRNPYAWNNVANVIFLDSPAGVGFSYGDESIINSTGDISTAKDAYAFLVKWFERFPQYKNRDFYVTGESYAGHYVPQLAYTILHHNLKGNNHSFINLKGIAIGNAWIDDATNWAGLADHLWTHALYSDETHAKIKKFCNFSKINVYQECEDLIAQVEMEMGNIDIYNIYAPVCLKTGSPKAYMLDSVEVYDPCYSTYVDTYLNIKEVQEALHARPTEWKSCSGFQWHDTAFTVLPVIKKLMKNNVRVWIYSGDVDGRVPVTSSKYSIDALKLPIETNWRPWYKDNQVGGYVVGYEGLVFVTVRGAGHLVPSDQPARALTLISSFLQGTLPPKSS